MTLGQKIKMLRESKGISQDELGKILGTNKQSIYKYENGIVTNIPIDKIKIMAEFFNVSPAYIMGWEDKPHDDKKVNVFSSISNIHPYKNKKVPLLGEIACGQPIYTNESRDAFVLSDESLDVDFCLTCKGDSMINARIFDGDIVFIKQQPTVDNGEIAAVVIDDEATLKRVYYYKKENKLILQAENPAYAPLVYIGEELDHINILGKAVAFQSLVK